MHDLEQEPPLAVRLCHEAHERLLANVSRIDATQLAGASALPEWSRLHVLTHLARNADAHRRRISGALVGEGAPKYADGDDQRRAEIVEGAGRNATEVLADLRSSIEQLDHVMGEANAAGWPGGHLRADSYPVTACPAHRLREIEMHHVDLDIGYGPSQWPAEYVGWEMTTLVATLPTRLTDDAERRDFLAWMAGRHSASTPWRLAGWG